jgi:hypothetical protein
MYCPQCASQLVDSARFCRACGADLKAVAMSLADQYPPAKTGKKKTKAAKPEKSWLEKRGEGIRKAIEGATMLGATLLTGVAFGLIGSHPDRMIIWAGIFGWMGFWGIISLATGLGVIMEVSSMGAKALSSQPADDPGTIPDTDELADRRLSPPLSVTEYTTESLGARAPSSKHTS